MPPKPSAKIPLSEIAKLEHLIDQEPAHAQSEVSKRQAVGMLAPTLYEVRHEAYAWRDVAAWLSGHGLTTTAAALRRHLGGVKDPGVRGRPFARPSRFSLLGGLAVCRSLSASGPRASQASS